MIRLGRLAVVLLLACRAAAQTPPLATSAVQGRVVKWGTGDPIAKATVELLGVSARTPAPYLATTAADGTFVFPSVPPGQYRIVSRRPGYVNAEYGQRWPNGVGTPLTIPAGRAVSNIPIPMLQTGAISGRVHDRLDQPIGNAEVQALKANYEDGRRVLATVQTAVSDDRGEFRLFWLPPGLYYLRARHPDIGGSLMRFSGVMFGGGGMGAAALQFQEFRNNGDNAAATAPPDELRQRRARQQYLPVYYPGGSEEESASGLELAPGAELTGIDFTLEPVPLQRVRGRVVSESNGEPAMSARVQWISSTGASAPSNENLLMGPRIEGAAVSCCDGAFELALPPGSYTLVAANNNINSRVSVQVGFADVDGIVISLGQSFNITGRVTFEGRAPTPAELNALRISLVMNPPVPGLQPSGYSTVLPSGTMTLPASRGDFRLNVSPLLNVPGAFVLPVRQGPGAFRSLYVKSIRLGSADVLNDGLHLDGRPDAPLEIVIGTTPGSLEGIVLNGDGEPVPNVAVSLLPDQAHRQRIDLYKSVSTDAGGRFKIDSIPPGDYVAFAWDGIDSGDWQNPEFLAPFESRGSRVRVTDNSSDRMQLRAIPPTR